MKLWPWALLIVLIALIMAVMFKVASSHAAACLSIDVPPQAVIGQHDGDTFDLFTFGPRGKVAIRVEGVDTPEVPKKKGDPGEPGWEAAKEFTREWLSRGPFNVTTCGKPTLDRIVGIVKRDERTLAQALIEAGHQKRGQEEGR